MVDPKTMVYGPYNNHASKVIVRDNSRDSPFAIFDFRASPRVWKSNLTDCPFYKPFYSTFKKHRSPHIQEPHLWLWIIKPKKVKHILNLYNNGLNIDFDIFLSTYVSVKIGGLEYFKIGFFFSHIP